MVSSMSMALQAGGARGLMQGAGWTVMLVAMRSDPHPMAWETMPMKPREPPPPWPDPMKLDQADAGIPPSRWST